MCGRSSARYWRHCSTIRSSSARIWDHRRRQQIPPVHDTPGTTKEAVGQKRHRPPGRGPRSSGWTSWASRVLDPAVVSSSGTSRGPPGGTIRRSGRSRLIANRFFKETSAEIISDLLSDARVKRVREYVQGEEFKADRDRVRRDAAERLKNIRERYRAKRRDPETVARERKLTLRLAEVEAEAAELRIQLSVLLEEEEKLRTALEEL